MGENGKMRQEHYNTPVYTILKTLAMSQIYNTITSIYSFRIINNKDYFTCMCYKFRLVARLDPHRASRKFTEQKLLEDPLIELKEKQSARLGRISTFASSASDDIEIEKKKAQRLEAAKQLEAK